MNFDFIHRVMSKLNGATDLAAIQEALVEMDESVTPRDLDDLMDYFEWRRGHYFRPLGVRVPEGMAIHHLDGDPHNNDPANLRFVNLRENRKKTASS